MKTDMTPPLRLLKLALAIGLACWLTSCSSNIVALRESSPSSASTKSFCPPQSNNTASHGQIVYLTWNNPTTNADGSPLNPSTLRHFTVTYSKNGGTPHPKSFGIQRGANSWASPCLDSGTYTFSVSVSDDTGPSAYSKKLTVEL